jgi:succinyl-diaminopimelate desuccinylase
MDDKWDARFDSQELLNITQRLIQIQSENPPGQEEHVAFFIRDELEKNGITSSLSWAAKGRPNLMAVLEGNGPGPVLMYNGHLDVVPAGPNWTQDPFGGLIQDGRLYGRGASDMKSGVAAMLYAVIVLKRLENPFKGKLILFFNSDEEYSNLGIRHFLQEDIAADYVVISEPSDLDACICHKGAGRYRIYTSGVAGHTSVVEKPDNSIYKMAKVVTALEELSKKIKQRTHEKLGFASLTVSKISGGNAPNIVPSHTVIEIDRRVLPGEKEEEVRQEIERTVKKIADREGFDFQLEPYLYIPPHIIDEQHILTKTAVQVASQVTNREIISKAFMATTEAPFFSEQKGIPTLILGPGSLLRAHTADEWVDVQEIIDASRIFLKLACDLLK